MDAKVHNIKVEWQMLPLDNDVVAAHLIEKLTGDLGDTVMIAPVTRLSRRSRKHLRLNKDATGYFVRIGMRGSAKMYLGRCAVTYLDGKATLFQFTFAAHDMETR